MLLRISHFIFVIFPCFRTISPPRDGQPGPEMFVQPETDAVCWRMVVFDGPTNWALRVTLRFTFYGSMGYVWQQQRWECYSKEELNKRIWASKIRVDHDSAEPHRSPIELASLVVLAWFAYSRRVLVSDYLGPEPFPHRILANAVWFIQLPYIHWR
jgi:hypothetical protein